MERVTRWVNMGKELGLARLLPNMHCLHLRGSNGSLLHRNSVPRPASPRPSHRTQAARSCDAPALRCAHFTLLSLSSWRQNREDHDHIAWVWISVLPYWVTLAKWHWVPPFLCLSFLISKITGCVNTFFKNVQEIERACSVYHIIILHKQLSHSAIGLEVRNVRNSVFLSA